VTDAPSWSAEIEESVISEREARREAKSRSISSIADETAGGEDDTEEEEFDPC